MNTPVRPFAPIAAVLAALLLSACAGVLPGSNTPSKRPDPNPQKAEGAGMIWECRHTGQAQCQSRPYR